jgi:hypothetical protein
MRGVEGPYEIVDEDAGISDGLKVETTIAIAGRESRAYRTGRSVFT